MNVVNLNEEITEVARELYEKSGRVEGHDLDNWFEAEKIVIARYREEKLGSEKPSLMKRSSTTKKSTKKAVIKAKKTKA